MDKILLPIDFPISSLAVVPQAAFLARHFNAEIILLHVVTPLSYPAGILEGGHAITARDLHAEIVKRAQKDLDESLPHVFDGISVRRLLLRGDPAGEIAQTARNENVQLIVMSTHGHGALYRFLLGSVAAKVLHNSVCPVWTCAYAEKAPAREFAVRNVLCALDLGPHSHHTLTEAARVAADFGAKLTLVHVTSSIEIYGPGGFYVLPEWKEVLVGSATKQLAKLQQEAGTEADVIVECGNVHHSLNQAAERSNSDVLVIGHLPAGGHLGENGSGYSIIRESHIPVLSV
jgi:nucleotide-binding universal stress UspA family protein